MQEILQIPDVDLSWFTQHSLKAQEEMSARVTHEDDLESQHCGSMEVEGTKAKIG